MQQDWRACPSGSGGLAVRRGAVSLLVRDGDPAHDELLSALLAAVDAAAADPAPGRRLARRVAGLLSSADVDVLPDLCLLAAVDGGGVAAMLVGDTELVVTSEDGEEKLSGLDVATWVDRVLRPPLQQVSVVLAGSTAGTGGTRCDLRDGIVAAGALVLVPAGAPARADSPAPGSVPAPAPDATPDAATAPAPAPVAAPGPGTAPIAVEVLEPGLVTAGARAPEAVAPAEPTALALAVAEPPTAAVPLHPATAEPVVDVPTQTPSTASSAPSSRATFTSVSLAEPLPAEELVPLPVEEVDEDVVTVLGITCSRGHFNDPSSVYCASCGISLVHQTHNLVPGPRSPLGVLVTDDGGVFTLTRDYVLGREPEHSDRVAEQGALPLPLQDPDRTLSRVHAAVVLHDWDVRVVDLGSANGTYVRPEGRSEWERLEPHEPRTVRSGTTIRVGSRTLDFDSHRR